jgi:stress response protein SCP2
VVSDSSGQTVAAASLPPESNLKAMVLPEVYRRAGSWRLRLVIQGYAGGLAAFVTE